MNLKNISLTNRACLITEKSLAWQTVVRLTYGTASTRDKKKLLIGILPGVRLVKNASLICDIQARIGRLISPIFTAKYICLYRYIHLRGWNEEIIEIKRNWYTILLANFTRKGGISFKEIYIPVICTRDKKNKTEVNSMKRNTRFWNFWMFEKEMELAISYIANLWW